jgi:hypothetical protein
MILPLASFSLPGRAIFAAALLLPFGLAFALTGLYGRSHPSSWAAHFSRGIGTGWWGKFVKWRIVDQAGPAVVVVWQDFLRCVTFIGGTEYIYTGMGMVLATLSYLTFFLLTGGAPYPLQNLENIFLWVAMAAGLWGGSCIGYAAAFRQVRSMTARLVYADLTQRQLADFRSPLLLLLPGVYILYQALVSYMVFLTSGPTVTSNDRGSNTSGVTVSVWIVFVGPAAMLIIVFIAEIFAAYIARLPRLLITADPKIAQQLDNIIRAEVVGRIWALMMLAVGSVGFSQTVLVEKLSPVAFSLGSISFFCGMLELIVGGMGVALAQGRLGGRLTGWPWRSMRQP